MPEGSPTGEGKFLEKESKSFSEMQDESHRRWIAIADTRRKEREAREQEFSSMPDVMNAPKVGQVNTLEGVSCLKCNKSSFHVERWVTVNGVKHRTEVKCSDPLCGLWGCYDFVTGWI